MKNSFILIVSITLFACSSIDERFKEKDALRLILMESVDEPYANPNEIYTYKLMAQSTSGLKRVEVANISHDLGEVTKLPTITMAEDVTVDENGYFNREVKTAIINYPITVPAIPGETIGLDFIVTDAKGNTQKVRSSMLIANYKENKLWYFANLYKTTNWAFYSSLRDELYGYSKTTATYYKKNIDFIDMFEISDGSGKGYYIMSPDSPEIEEIMISQKNTEYVPSEMRHTKFIVLEDVNYAKAKDNEILAIDFTNAVTKIDVKKNDVIGFITQDGRKGLLWIKGAAGKYVDFRVKIQTIAQ